MTDIGSSERAEAFEAFRAWHCGEALTDRQSDLIDIARIECLARAYGAGLGSMFAPGPVPSQDGRGYENRFAAGGKYQAACRR